MGRLAARAAPSLPWVLLFIVAFGGAFVLILPVHAGQVGYDTAASVLYFDRLLAGRHLESFVAATPKPLLTVVDGFLHAVTGDWRPISWLAIAVYALDVVLAGVLARRLAGPVAAAFAAVGVAGTWALLEDASAAYAVGPAVLFWLIAGLLTTAPRPRYGLAGVALLLAGLARFETLILVGLIAVVLIAWRLAAALGRTERPPSGAWLLLLALLALPIQILHDVLLTGDPFWSERVPVLVSEAGSPLIGVSGAIRLIVSHYAPWLILVVLAGVGAALLVVRRRWPIVIGLAAIGPGTLAFIVLLAARHVYISGRYLYPADLAVVFAAAIGIAAIRIPDLDWIVPDRASVPRRVAPLAAGALAAVILVTPYALLDNTLRVKVRTNLALFENVASALPTLDRAVTAIPGVRSIPTNGSPLDRGVGGEALLVPVLLRPRLSLDLDLPLTEIAESDGKRIGTSGTYPSPGQIVYHDPRNDLPNAAFAFLEVSAPTTTGAIRLVPLASNPARRYWVIRVDQP
jgi:hypothetical protein